MKKGLEPDMPIKASPTYPPAADPTAVPTDDPVNAPTPGHPLHASEPPKAGVPGKYGADITWRNRSYGWGLITVAFHWLTALAIIFLFPLGLWMTGLTYYDPWYKLAPDVHKSVGMMLFGVFMARVAWRFLDRAPGPVRGHKAWERKGAHVSHFLLYLIPFAVMISGYLISTADGKPISVFGLFNVPATLTSIPKQEDVAGLIHFWLAVALITVVAVHGGAALKHHFFDKDETLNRMLGRR